MKPFFSQFPRLGILTIIATGVVASTATAQPIVTVDLSGTTFGNNLAVHVNSGAEKIFPARSYGYEFEATVHGTLMLAQLIPNGTDLGELLETIQDGASSFLSGVVANPAGTLPFKVINRTFSGSVPISSFLSASASVTVRAKIAATGLVRCDVTNVNISIPLIDPGLIGTVVFESGSKLTVAVTPVIELKRAATTVSEDVGTVSLLVKRRLNAAGEVTVDYTTVAGTATLDDYSFTSGTLTFADGDTEKMIDVPIVNREDAQGERTFKVRLSHPGGGAILGVKRKEFVTITDAP